MMINAKKVDCIWEDNMMCCDEYNEIIAFYFRLEWELEYNSKGGTYLRRTNWKVKKQI